MTSSVDKFEDYYYTFRSLPSALNFIAHISLLIEKHQIIKQPFGNKWDVKIINLADNNKIIFDSIYNSCIKL